jgi:aspartate/methionine/tyrosine aminotransferase
MPQIATRMTSIPDSAISEMTALAVQCGAINLASGFPDFDPPAELLVAAERALRDGYNQYPDPSGSPGIRQALAAKQSRRMGLALDPETHITVTCGSTEAMLAALMVTCNPGDKVITFSPFYETYATDTILCGAQTVYVPIHLPDYTFDPTELRGAFQQGAKALVLCNPSNPTGRVFTHPELEVIAGLAQEYDAFVITDEVYEHIVYAPHHHTYIASLPGMFERTLSCSSLSKTYAITGWRLGYIIAPPRLTEALRKVHIYLTIAAPAPLQEAAIVALNFSDDYYRQLQLDYTRRRDIFLSYVNRAGLTANLPQGAHYILADISAFGYQDDMQFCRWMAREIGVAGVPGSSFFHEPVNNLMRMSFAKNEDTLVEAGQRLLRLKERG